MSNWLEDLRYALRALAARPLHALASIGVLALAIGANTTVFSVFDGLFMQPLPYPDGAHSRSAAGSGIDPLTALRHE